MTRAVWTLSLGLAAALMIAGCSNAPEKSDGRDLRKITFNMGWLPQGSMAGIYVAEAQGLYREKGLSVTPVRGFGGIRTVNELDQGMFEFGYGDPMAVALNRSKGGHTRFIAPINGRWPAGACFIRERHKIAVPGDMKGLSFGGGQASPIQALMPVWLKRNGVDPSKVKMMQLDPAVVVTSLIEDKVDLAECWQGNSVALFQKRAKEVGLTVGWISYADFGLDMYGSGIVTSETILKEHPGLARDFVAATYAGYAWAKANPEKAVEIMRNANPLLDPAVTRQQLDETLALIDLNQPRGSIISARVGSVVDLLGLTGKVAPQDLSQAVHVEGAKP